jgi:hypothetical protein
MSGQDPWADPRTETEPGAPYAGPPVTGPPVTGPPAGWPPPSGWSPAAPAWPAPYPYAGQPTGPGYPAPYPAWGWQVPPSAPRRPGQVIAVGVLAFVQAAVVLVASMYVFMLASLADMVAGAPGFSASRSEELATEGHILATVQLLSAVVLVVAGVLALIRRTRAAWLAVVAAMGLQVVLALYWAVRLTGLVGDGAEAGSLAVAALLFAAGPLVSIGFVLTGAGRRWFTEDVPA